MPTLDVLLKNQEMQEKKIRQYFNPEDMSLWHNKPPEEFVAALAHEFIAEIEAIRKVAEILNEKPEMQSIIWTACDDATTATFWIQSIIGSTRILDILTHMLKVYGKEMLKEGRQ